MVHVAGQAVATSRRQLQRDGGQERPHDGREQRDGGQDRHSGQLGHAGRSNLRIALILASIALVFFASVIANRILFN